MEINWVVGNDSQSFMTAAGIEIKSGLSSLSRLTSLALTQSWIQSNDLIEMSAPPDPGHQVYCQLHNTVAFIQEGFSKEAF